jgi:hypothetical protein
LNNKKLMVVIHVDNYQQATRNARIAFDAGADGIFLINHRIKARELLRIYYGVRLDQIRQGWIGLNFLDVDPIEALQLLPEDADALWVDNPGMFHSWNPSKRLSDLFNEHREFIGKDFLYFGGVAFKGQHTGEDPMTEVGMAPRYMDVVTTSGDRTGVPPELSKIQMMKTVLNPHKKPLAIASGITESNVHEFLAYTDYFLVATGVSRSFEELDSDKVSSLSKKIHEWK